MLYFDSCILVKCYFEEKGSDGIRAHWTRALRVFTSVLSYAETLAAAGRKCREGVLDLRGFASIRDQFLGDWVSSLNTLELDAGTLGDVPRLIEKYGTTRRLTGADAVHLSTCLWLEEKCRVSPELAAGESVEFWTSDASLAAIAADCGLTTVNPEIGFP